MNYRKRNVEPLRKPCKYCEEYFKPSTRGEKICEKCYGNSMRKNARNNKSKRKSKMAE